MTKCPRNVIKTGTSRAWITFSSAAGYYIILWTEGQIPPSVTVAELEGHPMVAHIYIQSMLFSSQVTDMHVTYDILLPDNALCFFLQTYIQL